MQNAVPSIRWSRKQKTLSEAGAVGNCSKGNNRNQHQRRSQAVAHEDERKRNKREREAKKEDTVVLVDALHDTEHDRPNQNICKRRDCATNVG